MITSLREHWAINSVSSLSKRKVKKGYKFEFAV